MTWAMIASVLIVAAAIAWMSRTVGKQLVVIHDLVNSNLTTVTANLELSEQRVRMLEQHIAGVEGEKEVPTE